MSPSRSLDVQALIRCACISLAAIFFLYPLLHELGHALAAWMLGGRVVRITVFPAFYTECYIRPEQLGCYIITAMAGILFPLIVSMILNTHNERGFLVAFCLQIMSVGYSAGEVVSVARCVMGSAVETSDLSVLTYETTIDPYVSLVLAGFLLNLSLILLVAAKPWIGFACVIQRFSSQQNDTSTKYTRKCNA